MPVLPWFFRGILGSARSGSQKSKLERVIENTAAPVKKVYGSVDFPLASFWAPVAQENVGEETGKEARWSLRWAEDSLTVWLFECYTELKGKEQPLSNTGWLF